MEYPIYDITFDPTQDIGMSAISFVDYPAICQDFVYFSKDGKANHCELKSGSIIMANAEKHEIVSPILIPIQRVSFQMSICSECGLLTMKQGMKPTRNMVIICPTER